MRIVLLVGALGVFGFVSFLFAYVVRGVVDFLNSSVLPALFYEQQPFIELSYLSSIIVSASILGAIVVINLMSISTKKPNLVGKEENVASFTFHSTEA